MHLSITILDEAVLVSLSGVVDSGAASRLYDTLVKVLTEGNRKLVIDLTDVDELTRAGMRGIIVAARLMRTKRGGLAIVGASGEAAELLKSFGLGPMAEVDDGLVRALAHMRRDARAAHQSHRPSAANTDEGWFGLTAAAQ